VKQLKKLSIVIPVYNSEKTIKEVVNEVKIAASKLNLK
jgi:glycosyltransferase involved in cell wall biosynthesis